MLLKGKKITFGITGSLYAIKKVIPQIHILKNEGADIIPIMSVNYYGDKLEILKQITDITEEKILCNIQEVENELNKNDIDIMIIAPCSGNHIAKLANGIMDTAVLKAVEKNLKNDKNIVIGIASLEGLGIEAKNIGKLLNMKKMFFIPFRQDNPITKPNSLMYSNKHILETTIKALNEEQIQPILV